MKYMTLTLIFIVWVMFGLIFLLGYVFAMQNTLHKVQEQILPETRKQIDLAKTEKDTNIIEGRLQVGEQLIEILRPPWMKKHEK